MLMPFSLWRLPLTGFARGGDPLGRPSSTSISDLHRSTSTGDLGSNISIDGQASINATGSSGEQTAFSFTNHSEIAERGSSSAVESGGRLVGDMFSPQVECPGPEYSYNPGPEVSTPAFAIPVTAPAPAFEFIRAADSAAHGQLTPNNPVINLHNMHVPMSPVAIISPLPASCVGLSAGSARHPVNSLLYQNNGPLSPVLYRSPSRQQAFIWPTVTSVPPTASPIRSREVPQME